MSVKNVDGCFGPDCPMWLDLMTRWSPRSSLSVPSVAWTLRVLEIGSYRMRGKGEELLWQRPEVSYSEFPQSVQQGL